MSGEASEKKADDPVIARAHAKATERFVTAGGPGGQHVNKVATAVQLRVNARAIGLGHAAYRRLRDIAGSKLTASGDILIEARNHRSQDANRTEARERLTELLIDALTPPKRRAKTRVNRIGKVKRLKAKKERGAIKDRRGRVTLWD